MSKLPPGILKDSKDIQVAMRIAKGMGMVDPAEGGKTKAANNQAKMEVRNKGIFERFKLLRKSNLASGMSKKKARAAALKQLELDGQDPKKEDEPLSYSQLGKIIKPYEELDALP